MSAYDKALDWIDQYADELDNPEYQGNINVFKFALDCMIDESVRDTRVAWSVYEFLVEELNYPDIVKEYEDTKIDEERFNNYIVPVLREGKPVPKTAKDVAIWVSTYFYFPNTKPGEIFFNYFKYVYEISKLPAVVCAFIVLNNVWYKRYDQELLRISIDNFNTWLKNNNQEPIWKKRI